jgi:hypothetical protein
MQNTLNFGAANRMEFQNVDQLRERFSALGAVSFFCKRLSENDNTKQQIYVGGSFRDLERFPFGTVRDFPDLTRPNMKAELKLSWVTPDCAEPAPNAQLILYPKYPEVRLSGFLSGCSIAPSEHLQPIPAGQRTGKKTRFLIFGITRDRQTLAYLAPTGSPVANALAIMFPENSAEPVFHDLPSPDGALESRMQVLAALRQIHLSGFHGSSKLNKLGQRAPYLARNAGGYTLEALLGISPNSKSEPDYLGWEIKGYGGDKITLMTPEPKGGYYGENGVAAFVDRYGYRKSEDRFDFNGMHKLGATQVKTKLTMKLTGFDFAKLKITDVGGALTLIDANGCDAAHWKLSDLLSHWNRKHALAAYVPYTTQAEPVAYRYDSPVLLAEGTDFPKFLAAMCAQFVIYDPACKIEGLSVGKPKPKARSQFRISVKRLSELYDSVIAVTL